MNLDECMDKDLKDHICRLSEERETLLRVDKPLLETGFIKNGLCFIGF